MQSISAQKQEDAWNEHEKPRGGHWNHTRSFRPCKPSSNQPILRTIYSQNATNCKRTNAIVKEREDGAQNRYRKKEGIFK